jgi:hypothetical protein
MKYGLTLVLIAELIIAFTLLSPTCILRLDLIHAVSAYSNDPTPENKIEMNKQGQITQLYSMAFSFIVFGFLAGPTLLIAKGRLKKQNAIRERKEA